MTISTTKYPAFHSYMTPINIFPSEHVKRTRTINIRSTIHSTNTNTDYYAKFTVMSSNCVFPTVTIWFQDTDFGGPDKFLNVYYQGRLLTTCGSNNDTCGDYKYCLNQEPLLNDSYPSILMDETIAIHLEKGKDSNVPSVCDYSLWADVTLSCDESFSPTEQPTVSPTQIPTAEPTTPTVDPTDNPTSEPTQEPTAEPTQEPTLNPTRQPTVEPTLNPTICNGLCISSLYSTYKSLLHLLYRISN